ncbi:hypothetical protein OEJ15_003892 [Escherichia coli]|uniref:Uncharacterized protein n=2 Tax=Enterobacteriaceae TaxID=543 RepID=A0A3U1AHH5_SALET|nr:hypothetical protein [Salmonella enterica subsp. enterica serovar Kisangani]EAM5988664.1 hypothetical protein [Salmonella enterica]EBR7918137.1 hypothetical protein [Salmonella enterica subsp. enterica serovar Java]EBW3288971.1 hypothetical protein [Salmonella enterica subsp. enterica serovar Typhimurium]ECA9380540.1 hypothetical protein [Salmonella enterica subsp. enterica serovar Montevideo]ECD1854020.1 hypothetical protein [Salmonella enterica subsp. enterica serovar Pomona]ECW0150047.1
MCMSKAKFITDWFYVPCASTKELERTGFFGLGETRVKTSYVNNVPDLEQYAAQLAESYNKLDDAGYDVVNVVPVAIGTSDQCYQSNQNYVGDVGYSITRGAVVVGKLRQ